ncbi:hypothetical protein BDV96DRAFT_690295 [Lophiotrema nucula]|uniref:Rhodopsin domain-containing protein n=1 Tax=Lophiotrema nucula TaxID=690887 RepID=A0A6A5YWP6_9PLEO|nr:hypothetical protein BDV96DRAFT_690295 [Lophiotrema nucula]
MSAQFAALSPTQKHALLEGPALKPPTGVAPNFIDPPNENAIGYSVVIICASLSAAVVIIRLYAKVFCTKKVDGEDYLAVAALVSPLWRIFLFHIPNRELSGNVLHQWNVQLKDLSGILYDINAGTIIYGNVIMLLKVGILIEWIHIFVPRGLRNEFFWICHITIWTNVMFYVACTVVEIFGCTPREKIWKKLLPGGRCVNNYAVILASSVINFISGIIVLALPQRIIWMCSVGTQGTEKHENVQSAADDD